MSARGLAKTSGQVAPPGLDIGCDLSALSAHIAAELAAGLSDAAAIRERYGISDAQWDILRKSPVFRAMLAEAVREFRGDLNAGARIRLKADIVIEDAIPAYDSMIHDNNIPAQARIDAGKLLAQLAGRTAKAGDGPATGGGFTLNINLHGQEKGVVIEGRAAPAPTDD